MRDCKQDKEEALDTQCSLGFIIVFVGSGTVLLWYLSAVYLSLKGVNIF